MPKKDQIRFRAKVVTYTAKRKHVEIPTLYRDDVKDGTYDITLKKVR